MPKGRRKAARVNQTSLAKKLGLSQFTVSEALRGSEKVAPETRQRVHDAAERMGYRIHASARATRTGRFGGIALLRGPIADVFWFPLDLLFGIEYQLDCLNQRLVMARLPADVASDETAIPRLLRELSVDGALVHCNRGLGCGGLPGGGSADAQDRHAATTRRFHCRPASLPRRPHQWPAGWMTGGRSFLAGSTGSTGLTGWVLFLSAAA